MERLDYIPVGRTRPRLRKKKPMIQRIIRAAVAVMKVMAPGFLAGIGFGIGLALAVAWF